MEGLIDVCIQAGIYGYGLDDDTPKQVNLPMTTANRLYKTIRENFGTIVFCRRYLDRLGVDRYLAGVRPPTFRRNRIKLCISEELTLPPWLIKDELARLQRHRRSIQATSRHPRLVLSAV